MKILTSNVQLTFTCENENCQSHIDKDEYHSDPMDVCLSGIPLCSECNEETVIEPECFIKN